MFLRNKDIVSITDFTADELLSLCKAASQMREFEENEKRYEIQFKTPKRLATLFYEPSTRTSQSFKTAITELGGTHDGFVGKEGTSIVKKETIRDTITMFEANHFDAIVMRHPEDGAVQWAADVAAVPVINGGDGKNEHPTQALLDLFTIYEQHGKTLNNVILGFGGDLAHGRTIRSLSLALSLFENTTIYWAAPDFLGMPEELMHLLRERGVRVIRKETVEEVLAEVDFYYMTRPQLERMNSSTLEDVEKMMQRYKIDYKKIHLFTGKLLHPLPINSQVAEIEYPVYFHSSQTFFRQAENGVLMRKALLKELLSDHSYTTFSPFLSERVRKGNNLLKRTIHRTHKHETTRKVRVLESGVVIDHLEKGTEIAVSKMLRLVDRGFNSVQAIVQEKLTSFLKTNLQALTSRELKQIDILSPEPTINYIRDGSVEEKFVFLLCKNKNCITRNILEDVPPNFYNDNETIRCRYCRRSYDFVSKKITEKEIISYKESLPKKVQ